MKLPVSFLIILIILLRQINTFSTSPIQLVNYENLEKIWNHSQYYLDKGYEFFGNMSDEDLRTYAALSYIDGKDPSAINFEDPPLAKYLFGFSYLLFKNILLVQFFLSMGVLIFSFLLSRKIGIAPTSSFIPVLILSFDPLFIKHSQSVNLDLPQLFFILVSIWLLSQKKLTYIVLILLGFSIGAVISSKVIFVGILFLLFAYICLWKKKVASLSYAVIIVGSLSLFVYFFSYSVYFLNHTLKDFIFLNIKILRMYRSYLPEYPWFEIWRIIFFGKWRTWFAEPVIQSVAEYWLAWPICTILTFSLLIKKELRRLPLKPEMILFGWTSVYLIFQSTHVVFPRYLVLALPFIYILGFYSLDKVINNSFTNLRMVSRNKVG